MFSTVNCGKNAFRPAMAVQSPAMIKKGLMVLSIKLFMDGLLFIMKFWEGSAVTYLTGGLVCLDREQGFISGKLFRFKGHAAACLCN
jgi:hypothetical protein